MEEDRLGTEQGYGGCGSGGNAEPTAAQRKHAAILERLSHRSSKPAAAAAAAPAFESVSSFLDRFSDARRSVEADIERCRLDHEQRGVPTGSGAKQDLEGISAAISDLEKLVAENSYFLPSYEVRTALKAVSDLKESLEKSSAALAPRKRFAFRSKPAEKKNPIHSVAGRVEHAAAPDVSDAIAGDILRVQARDSPAEFRNRQGSVIVKDFRVAEQGAREGEGDFSLCDLSSCRVYIRGKCRALFIHRLKNCHVYVGPVLGSVLIEEVEGCVFMLASHQIRIHQARATDFYLRVRSRPIIEDSGGVRFAPYMLTYEGLEGELKDSGLAEETGNWANVDDFRWLRAVQSPNWCVLPEEERRCPVDISEMESSAQ